MNLKKLLLGFIIGDSYGLSLLSNENNYLEIKDNKELNIKKGNYSFSTVNMLATMDSIINTNKINEIDILNRLCMSLILNKYTSDKKNYAIDKETLKILEYYSKKNNLNYNYNEYDTSGFCISRVLPIVIYNYYNNDTLDTLIPVLSITTSNEIVLIGCFIYYKYVLNLLEGYDKFKSLKIDIPNHFSNKNKILFKDILKNNIFYKDINFDDNIINILKITFYVILNSNNIKDIIMMISNLDGNINIYASCILSVGAIIYKDDDLLKEMYKCIKNKRSINDYINKFERIYK